MSAARTFGFALLGLVIGGATGTGIGLVGGLVYTELAHVSGAEGYSGFVVAYWMLAGLAIGLVVGVPVGISIARRMSGRLTN